MRHSQSRAGRLRRAMVLVLAMVLAGEGALAPAATALAANRAAAKLARTETVSLSDDASSPLDVHVGIGPHMSRVEFRGVKFAGSKREGNTLVLRFATRVAPLIPRLHVDPPPYLKDA